jgi:hypothetical protein
MMPRTVWRTILALAIAAWALLFWLVAVPAQAQTQEPASAVIDCGTLEGVGIVRVIVGGRILRVDVICTRT